MIKQIRTSALALSALLMMSCAGENTAQGDKNTEEFDTRGLTEFSTAPSSKLTSAKSGLPWQEDEIETRTTGEYTGSGIDFYWTTDDILWIHTDDDALNPLKKSKRSNIATLSAADTKNRTATAKFYFDGSFTKSSYTVRYTGKNSTSGDKVTIQAQQSQAEPNVARQLGESGDCGIATATMNNGRYEFTLRHQAAYLTFIPYNAPGDISTAAKLVKIKVTANKPLAGEYNFSDTGLDLATSPANPSNTIELSVGGPTGYALPTAAASDKSFTMVLAPGTYSSFKVEYIFKNQDDNTEISTTREYANLTFNAGKNSELGKDFDIRVYHPKYTLWDANNDLWYGNEQYQPKTPGGQHTAHLPVNEYDSYLRWANGTSVLGSYFQARWNCKDCPNPNILFWYLYKGDPHWDADRMWVALGRLFKGGVWLKRQSVIKQENLALLGGKNMEDGFDDGNGWIDWKDENNCIKRETFSPTPLSPSALNKYFFLPATGMYGMAPSAPSSYGRFDQSYAAFWSNISDGDGDHAWSIIFYSNGPGTLKGELNSNTSRSLNGLGIWLGEN